MRNLIILLLFTAVPAFAQNSHKMEQNDCNQFIATTMTVAVKFNVTVRDVLMHAGTKQSHGAKQ
jgi:archaellum biogenesis protein FlaJ (TadC family)